MRSSGASGTHNRTASGRLPIILFGDSDAAQGYSHIGDYDASVRAFQPAVEWACHMFCHQGEENPATWVIRDEIGPIGPFVATGILRGSWLLDLATKFVAAAVPVTFLAYPVGSSNQDAYDPIYNAAAYNVRLNWIKARLAQMPNHRQPILLTDQGIAGATSYGTWADSTTRLMTALRADLGCPTLGICMIRAPATIENPTLIAEQNLYPPTDPLCTVAYNDTMTYVDDTTLVGGQVTGVHFDAPGGRKLAIGPDDVNTTAVWTALQAQIARAF
jgi:hypothetical protein